MPTNNRTLSIVVNVQTAGAVQAIGNIQNALNGLTTGQQAANQQAKQAANVQSQVVSKYGAATNALNEYQQSIDKARRTAYAMTIGGYMMAASARKLQGDINSAVTAFTDFDFAVRRAAGALNAIEPSQMENLAETVQQTAIQTKLLNAEEVGRGFYYWASTTGQVAQSQQELLEVQRNMLPVIKTATMTEMDYQTAIKGTIGIIQSFSLAQSQTTDVTEKLFYVTMKTAAEYGDLLESFKMVGPVANQLGVTFEEVVRALGHLSNAGIKGTMAGRALRQVFRQLNRETPIATKALDEAVQATYGMNETFKDLVFPKGEFAGFGKLLEVLATVTRDMDDAQKGHMFSVIATAAEMPALIQLVNLQNKAMVEAAATGRSFTSVVDETYAGLDISDAANTWARQWAVIGESAKAVMAEMRNKIALVVLDFGKAAMEFIKPMATAVGNLAEQIHKVAVESPQLFKLGVGFIMASTAALGLVGTMTLIYSGFKLITGAVLPAFILEHVKAGVAAAVLAAQQTAVATTSTAAAGAMNAAAVSADGMTVSYTIANQAQQQWLLSSTKLGANLVRVAKDSFGLSTAVGRLNTVVNLAWIPFAKFGGALGKIGGLFKSFVTGSRGATTASTGFADAMAMNITLFPKMAKLANIVKLFGKLTIIGTAVVLILDNLDAVFRLLGATVRLVGSTFGALITLIDGILTKVPLVSDVVNILGDAFGLLNQAISTAVNGLADLFDWVSDRLDEFSGKNKGSAEAVRETWRSNMLAANEEGKAATASMVKYYMDQYEEAGTEVPLTFAESLAAQNTVVMEAAHQGIYLPVTLTLGELAKQTYQDGELVAETFQSVFFDNKDDFMAAAGSMSDSVITQIRSDKPKLRKAGYEALVSTLNGWYNGGAVNVSPAVSTLVNSIGYFLASEDETIRAFGAASGEGLMSDFGAGGANYAPVAMQWFLTSIHEYMQSSEPALQARGLEMMEYVIYGMYQSEPEGASKDLIGGVLAVVRAGGPAAYAEGYNFITKWTNGLKKGTGPFISIIAYMNSLLKQVMSLARVGESDAAYKISQQIEYLRKLMAAGNYLDVPQITIPDTTPAPPGAAPTPGGGTGGGGGGGGDKQTPLERALEVAQQAAELAKALKSIEGLNLVALVKKSMGHVAQAMALSINITAKYAKTVSKKTLEAVAEFANVASTVASAVGTAAAAFAQVRDFKPVGKARINDLMENIIYSVRQMSKASKLFKGASLGNASVFAGVAGEIASAFSVAFDAFSKLGGQYKGPTVGRIRRIAEDMYVATKTIAAIAKKFEQPALEAARDFSSAASAVVDAIGNTAKTFSEVGKYKGMTRKTLDAIMDDIIMAFRAFRAFSKRISKAANESVRVFAESISPAIDAIGSAVDAFDGLEDYKSVPRNKIRMIVEDIVRAFIYFRRESKGINQGALDAAKAFSEGVGPVIEVFAKAVDAFAKARDFVKPLPRHLKNIVGTIHTAVRMMLAEMRKFKMNDKQMEALTKFSEMAGSVSDAVGKTYDAFVKTEAFVDQFKKTINFKQVFGWIEYSVARMSKLASRYTKGSLEKISILADAAKGIAEAISAFFAIGTQAAQDPGVLGKMVTEALGSIMQTVANFVASFRKYGASLVDNFAAGIESRRALLAAEMESILPPQLTEQQNPTITIVHVIRDPDGSLRNANPQQVAAVLSGQAFIDNLWAAARSQ